ncbi:MAG TPA: hypothetical protein VM619_14695 [Luteimonas sp.]|nr:hypothetical protein [Luteimonas sp.]
MDEVIFLARSPAFRLGFTFGLAAATMAILAFLALRGARARRADRRTANVIAGALDQMEHFQRTGDAIFYGNLPAPPRTPEAANAATLDLRDAYRAPRGTRAELRSSPR